MVEARTVKLAHDPADGPAFWEGISRIPGYPRIEDTPIGPMLFESNALLRLPEVLRCSGARPAAPVLVVMDSTPMRRGADNLKALVLDTLRRAGLQAEALVLEPDATGQVHTDLLHIEVVQRRLREGMAVLSVGSGTVTDISKHAAHRFEQAGGPRLPFVVLQTANSVSAYTSNMAPTFVDGVKRTLASRYPDALVCDLETLRDAPRAMTVAGVGDLLAAFVSLPDWYLAHRLGLDTSYTRFPQALMGPLDDIFLAHAEAIRSGTLEGMALLAKLIALGGLAMSLAHASTPMSGYEHVISHILDLLAEKAGRPLAQHGTQVALAAVLGAEAYRHFLDQFEPADVAPAQCYPLAEAMQARIAAAFAAVDPSGRAGAECWADYRLKLEMWKAHRAEFEAVLRHWPEVRAELERLTRPPERLAQVLRAIGSPLTFAELAPPAAEPEVEFAFLNAPLMRRRLTLGDLLLFLNWDREALWDQVWARAQALGARAALAASE
jgi:glycerol-1-phosphate dehydrogenase [NAD(P)+]